MSMQLKPLIMLTFQVEYGHVVDCGCYRTAPCAYCSWLFFKLLPMLQQLSDKQIFSLTELVRACNHAPTILSYDCSLNFDFTVTGVIYKMLVVFSQSVTSDLTIVFAQWRTVCANYPLTTNWSNIAPIDPVFFNSFHQFDFYIQTIQKKF